MGLDITFNRIKRVELSQEAQEDRFGMVTLDELYNNVELVYDELAYYRKVNFLYRYFSDYMDANGIMAVVDKYAIEDVIERCKEVLADNSKAEELLPTVDGFFFGSTEYDKYYFKEVAQVLKDFEKILQEYDMENYFYFGYFSY